MSVVAMETVSEFTRLWLSRMPPGTRLFPPPRDVFKVTDGCCYYCGDIAEATDHVLPRARGGRTVRGNLVPACRSCNSSKRDSTLEEFRERRGRKRLQVPRFSRRQVWWLERNGFVIPDKDAPVVFWGEAQVLQWLIVPADAEAACA